MALLRPLPHFHRAGVDADEAMEVFDLLPAVHDRVDGLALAELERLVGLPIAV
jgi:hypothetical protein